MLRKVGLGLLAALACLAMFDIPSAYASTRGAPWGLALAVGLLAFPVLPVAWHLWGERDKAKKRHTTKGERFALRTAAIAILSIGGLIAFARGPTWRAMRDHALWMLPGDDARGLMAIDDAPILRHLPPDADGVIWLQPNAEANAMFGKLVPELKTAPELLGAIAGDEAVLFERGDADIVANLAKIFDGLHGLGMPSPPLVQKTLPDGIKMWATDKAKVDQGAPTKLLDLLRGAPRDAFIVVAALPRKQLDLGGASALRAVLRGNADAIEVNVELYTDHPAALKKEIDQMIDKQGGKDFRCFTEHGGLFDISEKSDEVQIIATVDLAHADALKKCF